jgi:DNA-binding CsgD family transcriptional regulator
VTPQVERFVGRRDELREISALAVFAAAGSPQTIMIEGRPGIGKTALMRRALRELADFGQLLADFANGGAEQLLARVSDSGQRGSERSAGGGLLTAVRAMLEDGGPTVLALDNVQCIDAKSAGEFSAALPELGTAPLLIIAAARDPWRPKPRAGPEVERLRRQLLGSSVSRMPLAELTVAETRQLLGRAGAPASDQTARHLHGYTGGHPALLSVLMDQVPVAADTAPADLVGLLDPLVMSILRTVSALPAPSQDLLAAMAVSEEPWPLAILGSVAEVDDPFAALEPLLDAGFVEWFPADQVTPVRIRYPLIRDVIYRSLAARRRAALHAQAARFALGTRAWAHRVAAAPTGEPLLAAALAREAERYYLAGDNEGAGTLIMWSAVVATDSGERDRVLLVAAQWWLTLRAVNWGSGLQACLDRWPPSAARSLILGLTAEAAGQYAQANALLAEADELAGQDSRSMVLMPAIELGKALVSADLGDVEAEYGRASRLLAHADLPAGLRGWAEFHAADSAGRMSGPEAALAKLSALAPDDVIDDASGAASAPAGSQSVRLWARGSWRLLGGRLRAGNEDLTRLLRAADRAAADSVAPAVQAYLAYGHYLLGEWKSAEQSSDQAVHALSGHAVARLRVPVHALAACLDASAGRFEQAEQHVQAAHRWYADCGPTEYAVFLALAGATVAQAHGDYGRMLIALQPLLTDPGKNRKYLLWWQPLHVEALVGTGQLVAAQQALNRLSELSGRSGRPTATVSWLQAWLAATTYDEFRARTRFEEAAARPPAPDDIPLHRARLEHEYGRFLMSRRNRKAAIGRLRRAYELYRGLGARPFADRCASDLDAYGVQPSAPTSTAPAAAVLAGLSPRERRIAYLAVQGLTNAEIASEVFISAKTVEYHLGKVFAKLGISSRRQLPAWLDEEPGEWP